MSSTPLLSCEPNPLIGVETPPSSSRRSNRSKGFFPRDRTLDTPYRSLSITLWPEPDTNETRRDNPLLSLPCCAGPMKPAMSPTLKNHLVVALGELVGTFSFLFFAFAATNVVNTAPSQGQPSNLAADPARLLFICLSFGMSLAVNASAFAPICGAMFNPAVTLGLLLIRQIDVARAALVIPAQLLGGVAAAGMASALTPGPLVVATALSEGTSTAQGFFIELFLTAMLVFVIFMLAVEQPGSALAAPIGIGLALFLSQLAGVFWTGGSLNPARSLGPNVVNARFESYDWIYWIGPGLGAMLASGLYGLFKLLRYETVFAGADQPVAGTSAKEDLGPGAASAPPQQA